MNQTVTSEIGSLPSDSTAKAKVAFLLGFAAYFAVLWTFWESPAIYPLKIFVVMLHEVSHGLVAVATGGSIERIVLDPMQGGACYCPGGSAFLTLSAGYLGSLIWGTILVAAGQSRRGWTRGITVGIGVLVLALTALYVRSSFGIAFGAAFGLALLLSGRFLPAALNRIVLIGLGLTSCLYAILDIKSDVIDRSELESDARMLAELTGIPTVLWGFLWIAVALVFAWLALRRAYRKAA